MKNESKPRRLTNASAEAPLCSLEEFLTSAREAEQEVERLTDLVQRLDARARRVTAAYHACGGGQGNGPEEVWIQLRYQRERLAEHLTEAVQQQEKVERFIARLGRSREREILRLRFLNYLTLEKAASRMGYSHDAAKRLSAQAMRTARQLWERDYASFT